MVLISAINKEIALLPREYQQVEFITIRNNNMFGYKNGIDTGVSFSSANKIEFELSSTDNSNNMMLFCGSGKKYGVPYLAVNTSGIVVFGIDGYEINPSKIDRVTISNGDIHEIQFEFSANSTESIYFGSWTDINFSRTINWYSFKIYKDNELLKNFIPCYRKADNVAGMYDIVNDKFYTNTGAGDFIVGGDI
jgi:hypothetical protein